MLRPLPTAALCAVLLAGLGAEAGPAAAHARLVRSEPADGAVLAGAPREVRVFFDDSVTPAAGNEVVRNGHGSVLAGKARLAPGTHRVLVLPLRGGLPRGDYSVRWRIVSDDGHLIAGVLAFGVGAGRAPPTSALSAGGTSPGLRDTLARWLFLGGLLLAVGTAAFSFAVWRPVVRAAGVSDPEHGRFCALLAVGCVLVFVGGSTELHGLSTSTRFGVVTAVAVFAAAGVAMLAAVAYGERRLRVVAEAAALPLVLLPTLAGHALDPGRAWIEPVADALHVASAAIWFGGLVALFAVVPRAARREPELAGRVVRRFSALALGAVALLSLTGLVRALSELTSFHQLWTIGYGRAILVKTAFLAALALLAWVNRYRLVPRLPEARASARLRESVGAEVVLFAGLVAAVAVLTQLRPGRDAVAAPSRGPTTVNLQPPQPPPRGALVLAREAGALAVALAVEPRRLTATVLGPSGEALTGLPVSFRVGSATLRAHPCGRGCYEAVAPELARAKTVELVLPGQPVRFELPRSTQRAAAIVARAARVTRHLRSLVYVESLRSGPKGGIVTTWRMAAPNRVTYDINGGGAAVVIGRTRWDRDSASRPWTRSQQIPALRVPQPAWGDVARNARVLGTGSIGGRPVWIVSFANPTIPAWFTVWIDRKSYRTLRLRMTAAAHFMFHRYLEFDRPLRIVPPRR
jgi:copper transport protein